MVSIISYDIRSCQLKSYEILVKRYTKSIICILCAWPCILFSQNNLNSMVNVMHQEKISLVLIDLLLSSFSTCGSRETELKRPA